MVKEEKGTEKPSVLNKTRKFSCGKSFLLKEKTIFNPKDKEWVCESFFFWRALKNARDGLNHIEKSCESFCGKKWG